MQSQAEVFFHVGLGKTGTTYLQYRVFPFFKGIKYIQRTVKNYPSIIRQKQHDSYLLSHDYDRQLEEKIDFISSHFPQTNIIVVLRRNESWIASQYRRHIKNGRSKSFQQFFDIEEDKGFWQQKDLYFYPKLKYIEEKLGPPLVLFHDDMKKDPMAFFARLANFVGGSFDPKDINLKPKHRSYNEKQLRLIRQLGKYVLPQTRKPHKYKLIGRLLRWRRLIVCYTILYAALIIPDSWIDQAPLITEEEMKKVRNHYADDWQKCLDYAQKHNPELVSAQS